jgi:hypothetical protein
MTPYFTVMRFIQLEKQYFGLKMLRYWRAMKRFGKREIHIFGKK